MNEHKIALNRDRVCELIDVSPRTLRRLIAAGRFPRPDVQDGKVALWSREKVVSVFKDGNNGRSKAR